MFEYSEKKSQPRPEEPQKEGPQDVQLGGEVSLKGGIVVGVSQDILDSGSAIKDGLVAVGVACVISALIIAAALYAAACKISQAV